MLYVRSMKTTLFGLAAMIAAVSPVCLPVSAAETNSVPRLSEVVVSDSTPKDEALVGPYQQPEWTTQRRFPTTRVYIQQPPWGVGVEQWWRGRFKRGGDYEYLFQEEIEIGLPHRFQIDLYENLMAKSGMSLRHHDFAAEVRWAPADWGKIPLNPAIYGEWKFVDSALGPNVFEIKLLLGEQIAPRWHWGLNLVYEQEVGQARATEWAVSQGLSYTLIDGKLSAGIEMKATHETESGTRGDAETKLLLGPSVQWRPFRNSHLDIVPLFGVTPYSPRVEMWLVFGFDFGPGNEKSGPAPVSTRSQ